MAARRDLDFRGERLDDADFSGARLHSPNLEGTRITDGWPRNADISGYIDGLRVNGVEVAPLVEAELDRRFPERVKLRAVDPLGLSEAWAMIEEVWATTVARTRTLPEALLYERVDDDWSFVETLRHLVMATDAVEKTIAALSREDLERLCVPPESPGHPDEARTVVECLHVIINEEWEHSRYANRDLAILEARQR